MIEFPHTEPGRSPLPAGGIRLDAAIVWAEPRDRWVLNLAARGIRVVNCGPEWTGTEDIANVHFDYREINRLVLAHLKPLSPRSMVAMGHRSEGSSATYRPMDQFAVLARQAHLVPQVWNLGGAGGPALPPARLLQPDREYELASFLGSLSRPAAIFCTSDSMAFLVSEVATRLGLRIPDDLMLVGEGDNTLSASASPTLTSVAGDALALGETAARVLAEWLSSGTAPQGPVIVPGARLIARDSTTGGEKCATLQTVRRMIETEALRGVTLGELVSVSGLSSKTLVRRYRMAFGLDPMEDIHRLRLGEAKRLLAGGALKIAQVATECGFPSQAAFNNYFRRKAGCSPSVFRRGGVTTRHGNRFATP